MMLPSSFLRVNEPLHLDHCTHVYVVADYTQFDFVVCVCGSGCCEFMSQDKITQKVSETLLGHMGC